jgi:hypothetical protein
VVAVALVWEQAQIMAVQAVVHLILLLPLELELLVKDLMGLHLILLALVMVVAAVGALVHRLLLEHQ